MWQNFSESEIDNFVEQCFVHYREHGFPFYDLSDEQISKEFKKLKNFDTNTIILENDKLKQVMLGLNLANYFMPHMYKVKSNNFKSPFEAFSNDDMLYKAIKKRIDRKSVV